MTSLVDRQYPDVLERLEELGLLEDPEELEEMAETFLDSARELLPALGLAISSGDPTTVHESSHTLKGASLSFGATRLSEISRAIDEKAKAGTLDGVAGMFGELESEFRSVESFVGSLLQNLLPVHAPRSTFLRISRQPGIQAVNRGCALLDRIHPSPLGCGPRGT